MSASGYEQPPMTGELAKKLATELIHNYFTTQYNPLTRHHLDSYDQFLETDLPQIIRASNPLVNLKSRIGTSNKYEYKVEVFVGGEDAKSVYIGVPSIVLQNGQEVRALYPNEARLRNLTYGIQVEADILVKITLQDPDLEKEARQLEPITIQRIPLFTLPLMLHSKFCLLSRKSAAVLREMGECPQDQGGYFLVEGAEKVLVTRQEGAFNTLWIAEQPLDMNNQYYASISSLDPHTRQVKRASFFWTRDQTRTVGFIRKEVKYKESVLEVQIPNVMKPIPVFVLFRALGVQSDKDILQLIFPDLASPEAAYLAERLIPSMTQALPFTDTYSAIEYIRTLTKDYGTTQRTFSVAKVQDILHSQLFPHVEDQPGARAHFLAECVRKILRVVSGMEQPPSRDDTRNQRLLSSGFLVQMLFQNVYQTWLKAVSLAIDERYNYNKTTYSGEKFADIFGPGNIRDVFRFGLLTEGIMRGFKGKWIVGSGGGDDKTGALQALSRLSYLDFMSHCRRVVLEFDTGMKLTGPRKLDLTQYGYFCPAETPSGSHIGITKNMTMFMKVSPRAPIESLLEWLYTKGQVVRCESMTPSLMAYMVPVFVNAGIVGYTGFPKSLSRVLRLMKRTGCLPPLSSSGFSIQERRLFIYMDDGRPLRPLISCEPRGVLPPLVKFKGNWRDLVVGDLEETRNVELSSTLFMDPLKDKPAATLDEYVEYLLPHIGVIEYVDPYEQNDTLIANWPEHLVPNQTTHMEVHPSTMMGLLGSMIPFPNHNQSPRNQLSASQSKQGLSMYASNWKNRYDNSAHILCYGQTPLVRTLYQDYVGNGMMPYGQNIILAMGMYGGYNQEDGIIMNADALARGQFRSIHYKSYEAFEENDPLANTKTRIGNPKNVPGWTDLNSSNDYSKLDDTGIIRVGEYVDQTTVIVGKYMMGDRGTIRDASMTAQVWTSGRVEEVLVTVNNQDMRLVKIRVTQDRVPELGDKFSNRHGQKGTINVLYRGHDMPRTADGIVPDMIMNPTAIPSRMTIGQILEQMLGITAANIGAIGNCTAFMNDGSPHEYLGEILEKLGLHRLSNQVLYNGMTGEQIEADIFMGVVYGMRLKHMTQDKWNARGQGRREQRTHQPTGGRGNEGGLKIGEMERDTLLAHGIATFTQESMMLRSDGTDFYVCNGCGTIPIYNETQNLYICPLCDGPIEYSGSTSQDLDPIPAVVRSATTFSKVQMPFATQLFMQELNTFLNMSMRVLTTRDVTRLKGMDAVEQLAEASVEALAQPLPARIYPEHRVPERIVGASETDLVKTTEDLLAELADIGKDVVEAPIGTAATEAPLVSTQPANGLAQPAQPPTAIAGTGLAPPPVEVADGVAPVINIDTSAQALAREGLVAPAPESAIAAPPVAPPPTRRFRRPAVSVPAAPAAPAAFLPPPPPMTQQPVQDTFVPVLPQATSPGLPEAAAAAANPATTAVAYGSPAAAAVNQTALVQEGGYPSEQPIQPMGPLTVIKLG